MPEQRMTTLHIEVEYLDAVATSLMKSRTSATKKLRRIHEGSPAANETKRELEQINGALRRVMEAQDQSL